MRSHLPHGTRCRFKSCPPHGARLAQSVERTPFKRVVVGSSPTVGVCIRSYLRKNGDKGG